MEEKEVTIDKEEVEEVAQSVVESLDPEEAKLMEEMMGLGVFYGRSKSRTNPKMRPFILANRSGFGVINLRKTYSAFKTVKTVIEDVISKQGLILFVGTSPSVKGIIREAAEELELPYVTERWLGGTLTNTETISKRVRYLKKLKEDKASGELEKYTKKERLGLERDLLKLEKLFGGIATLDRAPSLMFVADLNSNDIAAKEARQTGVKIIGILNTDADPDKVDYGIPANDRNNKSIEFIVNKIKEMIIEARKKVPTTLVEEKGEQKVPAEGALVQESESPIKEANKEIK
ncbi:MAG: 30S ribosomal protein S2 [Patescibacteria group bacterium]